MDETRMGFLADVAHAGQERSCSRPASTSRVAIGNDRRPVVAGIASMRPCGKAASWPPFRKAIDEPATPTISHRRHGQGTQRRCTDGGILTRPDTARSTRPRWAKPGAGGPSAPRPDHHRRVGVGVERPASSRCTTAGRRNARTANAGRHRRHVRRGRRSHSRTWRDRTLRRARRHKNGCTAVSPTPGRRHAQGVNPDRTDRHLPRSFETAIARRLSQPPISRAEIAHDQRRHQAEGEADARADPPP